MMYDMDKKVVRDWQTYTVDFNFDGKSDWLNPTNLYHYNLQNKWHQRQ
jgi:hypothetical protein